MTVWCAGVHTCTPNGHLYSPKWQCENFKTCIVYNIRLLCVEITFNSCCILLFSHHNGMFKPKNIASWSSWPGQWNDELLLASRQFFFPDGTCLSSYSSDSPAIPSQFRVHSDYLEDIDGFSLSITVTTHLSGSSIVYILSFILVSSSF
jgi:hypothetical protein